MAILSVLGFFFLFVSFTEASENNTFKFDDCSINYYFTECCHCSEAGDIYCYILNDTCHGLLYGNDNSCFYNIVELHINGLENSGTSDFKNGMSCVNKYDKNATNLRKATIFVPIAPFNTEELYID